jgi:hypothetical protein
LSEDDPRGALQHYQAAIDILNAQLKGKERAIKQGSNDDVDVELRATIVRALIGMVEIWMDPSYDLWYISKPTLFIMLSLLTRSQL